MKLFSAHDTNRLRSAAGFCRYNLFVSGLTYIYIYISIHFCENIKNDQLEINITIVRMA